MALGGMFRQLATCFCAVGLVAGQNTQPVTAGPYNSTTNTDKYKPSAGIPLTNVERRKTEGPADRRIAQQIRRAMAKDGSLSAYARNVTITCQNGMVTLRGPVGSGEEKQSLEAKAVDVAGSDHVKSELAVRPSD